MSFSDPNKLFKTDIIKSDEAEFFIGREKTLRTALDQLGKKGACAVIYGEAGVGKSSAAWQIATIIEGKNTSFSRSEFQHVGRKTVFIPIFLASANEPKNVNILVARLLSDRLSEYSLQERFKDVIDEWDLNSQFSKLYGCDLNTVGAQSEPGDYVFEMLDQLMEAVATKYRNRETVIFIDEVDRIDDKSGLGSLIKRVDKAKFVLIGIADIIEELIDDHQSTGRRLIGGDIEIKPLGDRLIENIFRHAQSEADFNLQISDGFLKYTKRISVGFPWVAQNIGYYGILNAIKRRSNSKSDIHLKIQDARAAAQVVRDTYSTYFKSTVNFSELREYEAQNICIAIAKSRDALSTTDVNKAVSGRTGETGIYLNRLEDANILYLRRDGRYRFTTPIVRSLVLDEIDRRNGRKHIEVE